MRTGDSLSRNQRFFNNQEHSCVQKVKFPEQKINAFRGRKCYQKLEIESLLNGMKRNVGNRKACATRNDKML